MSSIYNGNIKISLFGESHGTAIGAVLDNLPAGEKINFDELNWQMQRRAPGYDKTSTERKETDIPKIISGIRNGYTTGAPICAIIKNKNVSSDDYRTFENLLRPGHADYTAGVKYNGFNDSRGGGHLSVHCRPGEGPRQAVLPPAPRPGRADHPGGRHLSGGHLRRFALPPAGRPAQRV